MENEELISLLIAEEDCERRTALIQSIRLKFIKISHYKGIPPEDIDDVVNDGIEKLLMKLPSFHGKGPFNNWASVLMGNECLDYHRRCGVRKRFFATSIVWQDSKDEEFCENLDGFPDERPDPSVVAENRQILKKVMSVVDGIILETANLREDPKRDAEIARLGLKELLDPQDIFMALTKKYPDISLNAIRIVLHKFRLALSHAVGRVKKKKKASGS